MDLEPNNRIKIDYLPDGIRINIQAPRNLGVLTFMIFWLVIWTGGGFMALRMMVGGASKLQQIVGLVWLISWLVAEVFVLFQILWQITGKEIASVRDGKFYIEKSILKVFAQQMFEFNQIRNMRPLGPFAAPFARQATFGHWGFIAGAIAFDVIGITYRFGIGLKKDEATKIIELLKEFLP